MMGSLYRHSDSATGLIVLLVDPFVRYGEIRGIPITFAATGIPAGSDASREKPCDRVRNARKSGHASRPHLITTPWCAINTPTSLATPIPNVKAVDTLARYGHPPASNFKGLRAQCVGTRCRWRVPVTESTRI